jgi:hypothetical protein
VIVPIATNTHAHFLLPKPEKPVFPDENTKADDTLESLKRTVAELEAVVKEQMEEKQAAVKLYDDIEAGNIEAVEAYPSTLYLGRNPRAGKFMMLPVSHRHKAWIKNNKDFTNTSTDSTAIINVDDDTTSTGDIRGILQRGTFFLPVRDFNGGRTRAPVAIRKAFVNITKSYGLLDTKDFTYWSIQRYPAAHNGSQLTISLLESESAVSTATLQTLDHDAKLQVIALLNEERQVIRNLTAIFIRDNSWKKAKTLLLHPVNNHCSIMSVTDILDSMHQEMTLLNWAKGCIAYRIQFQGRQWIDDLEGAIMDGGFGGTPIRYFEEYDTETGVKLHAQTIAATRNPAGIPTGRKRHPKFSAIANVVKRKCSQLISEFETALGKRTGYTISWDTMDKKTMYVFRQSDIVDLANKLKVVYYTGKRKNTNRFPWPEAMDRKEGQANLLTWKDLSSANVKVKL